MRYGIALLASSFTNQDRPSFSEDVRRKLSQFLTKRHSVPDQGLDQFKEYLSNKPGSRRYTPLRKKLKKGQSIRVEHQDLLLSNPKLPSSVGALTRDYFDDALSLAHMLRLVNKHQNLLLARGRLSLSTGWVKDDPFQLREMDSLYLGLWILSVDCDWLWAFLLQIPDSDFEITVQNRVDLLLGSWKHILAARQIRSGHPRNAKIRTRLIELLKITERNRTQKVNLGQPWSWFLIPRLELLVDAGILRKKKRHGLTGYRLTPAGLSMRAVCETSERGESLIDNYFSCHGFACRSVMRDIEWEAIEKRLSTVASELRTSVGYFPIFETASALCVSQFLSSRSTNISIWEVNGVKARLWKESRSPSPRVRLGIDRQGQIYAFKLVERQ